MLTRSADIYAALGGDELTHWSLRMMHIYVSALGQTMVCRRFGAKQLLKPSNDHLLSIGLFWISFSEIWIKIRKSFKMYLQMSYAKRQSFCLVISAARTRRGLRPWTATLSTSHRASSEWSSPCNNKSRKPTIQDDSMKTCFEIKALTVEDVLLKNVKRANEHYFIHSDIAGQNTQGASKLPLLLTWFNCDFGKDK